MKLWHIIAVVLIAAAANFIGNVWADRYLRKHG